MGVRPPFGRVCALSSQQLPDYEHDGDVFTRIAAGCPPNGHVKTLCWEQRTERKMNVSSEREYRVHKKTKTLRCICQTGGCQPAATPA